MAQTCSSGRSTPGRGSGYDTLKTPPTPQVIEIEDDASDKSMDDVPADGNFMNGNPSDNDDGNAGRRIDRQETDINIGTVHHAHMGMEIDQEELLVVENAQGDSSHAQGHLQQTHTEGAARVLTKTHDDESTSSRQSSTDPGTPGWSPGATKNNRSAMLNSTWETVSNMSERIKRGLCVDEKKNVGHAYLLEDNYETGRFKIGSSQTTRIQQRVTNQIRDCNLQGWNAKAFPQFPLRGYIQLERIAHKELHFMNERFKCEACKTDHTEYFRGEKEIARETLEFWAQWLERCEPYDSNGELLPFWVERLDMLKNKSHYDRYFQCLDPSCSRDSGLDACRGCLRAGWKAWTEPENSELEEPELEEAERKASEKTLPMPLPLFNIISVLAVISFVIECIPLLGNIVHPNVIRKIQSLLVLCLWVYQEMARPTPEVSIVKPNQKPPEGFAKTPKKQSTVTGTIRTAPAKLNASRHVEQPGNTPIRMPFQHEGQIPDTEPIKNSYDREPRWSATDESPSKAALARKQKNRLNRRSIEQALERTFNLPSMQKL